MIAASLRALLTERIDYAGLFPPAALSMREAVANYAAYRVSSDAWALARFILPVVRLEEFAADAAPHLGGPPWRLAVLAQATDADAIRAFNARLAGRAVIDTVESRAATADDVEALAALASLASVYVELPVRDNSESLVHAVAASGLRAKIRTGGVTAESFPATGDVARFLAVCARQRVLLKATAGLHHPLCGEYPLTYEADAARGAMYGFLNVFLAASFARRGLPESTLQELLGERTVGAFQFDDDSLTWRGHSLTASELADDRTGFAVSFGSCSFREPLDDLRALLHS